MSCYSPRSAKHPQLATKMMRADAGLHPDEGAHAFPQIPKTFFASARLVHLISCPECSARVLPAHKCGVDCDDMLVNMILVHVMEWPLERPCEATVIASARIGPLRP
jgi:hypothetical protein